VEQYIYQKIFVLKIHVLAIVNKPETKTSSIWVAARSIATFDMDRICVCEVIILSVFLKIPYKDMDNKWKLQAILDGLKIGTLWKDFLDDVPENDEIRKYIHDAFVFENKSSRAMIESVDPIWHVQNKLIRRLIDLATEAFFQDMHPNNCQQLLEWAKLVWDRLPRIGTEVDKEMLQRGFIDEMNELSALLIAKLDELYPARTGSSSQS
jgi:hypothetical protein